MTGFVIFVLLVIAAYIAFFVYMKARANQILSTELVDVDLPIETVIEIGTKASGSLLQRMATPGGRLESATKRPAAGRTEDGAFEWRVSSKGGILAFRATQQDGRVRVVSAAEKLEIAQFGTNLTGFMGLGFAIANAFYRAIGLPRDPATMIRCRKRVFRALTNA